eukprot:g4464.t1
MSSDEEDWTSVPAKKAKQPADKKTKLYGAEAIAESGERITGKVIRLVSDPDTGEEYAVKVESARLKDPLFARYIKFRRGVGERRAVEVGDLLSFTVRKADRQKVEDPAKRWIACDVDFVHNKEDSSRPAAGATSGAPVPVPAAFVVNKPQPPLQPVVMGAPAATGVVAGHAGAAGGSPNNALLTATSGSAGVAGGTTHPGATSAGKTTTAAVVNKPGTPTPTPTASGAAAGARTGLPAPTLADEDRERSLLDRLMSQHQQEDPSPKNRVVLGEMQNNLHQHQFPCDGNQELLQMQEQEEGASASVFTESGSSEVSPMPNYFRFALGGRPEQASRPAKKRQHKYSDENAPPTPTPREVEQQVGHEDELPAGARDLLKVPSKVNLREQCSSTHHGHADAFGQRGQETSESEYVSEPDSDVNTARTPGGGNLLKQLMKVQAQEDAKEKLLREHNADAGKASLTPAGAEIGWVERGDQHCLKQMESAAMDAEMDKSGPSAGGRNGAVVTNGVLPAAGGASLRPRGGPPSFTADPVAAPTSVRKVEASPGTKLVESMLRDQNYVFNSEVAGQQTATAAETRQDYLHAEDYPGNNSFPHQTTSSGGAGASAGAAGDTAWGSTVAAGPDLFTHQSRPATAATTVLASPPPSKMTGAGAVPPISSTAPSFGAATKMIPMLKSGVPAPFKVPTRGRDNKAYYWPAGAAKQAHQLFANTIRRVKPQKQGFCALSQIGGADEWKNLKRQHGEANLSDVVHANPDWFKTTIWNSQVYVDFADAVPCATSEPGAGAEQQQAAGLSKIVFPGPATVVHPVPPKKTGAVVSPADLLLGRVGALGEPPLPSTSKGPGTMISNGTSTNAKKQRGSSPPQTSTAGGGRPPHQLQQLQLSSVPKGFAEIANPAAAVLASQQTSHTGTAGEVERSSQSPSQQAALRTKQGFVAVQDTVYKALRGIVFHPDHDPVTSSYAHKENERIASKANYSISSLQKTGWPSGVIGQLHGVARLKKEFGVPNSSGGGYGMMQILSADPRLDVVDRGNGNFAVKLKNQDEILRFLAAKKFQGGSSREKPTFVAAATSAGVLVEQTHASAVVAEGAAAASSPPISTHAAAHPRDRQTAAAPYEHHAAGAAVAYNPGAGPQRQAQSAAYQHHLHGVAGPRAGSSTPLNMNNTGHQDHADMMRAASLDKKELALKERELEFEKKELQREKARASRLEVENARMEAENARLWTYIAELESKLGIARVDMQGSSAVQIQ